MLDEEQLDAQWRDGLLALAAEVASTVPPGAPDRVDGRIHARARRRAMRRGATSVVAIAAALGILAFAALGDDNDVRVHTRPAQPARPARVADSTPALAQIRVVARTNLKLGAQVDMPGFSAAPVGDEIRLPQPGVYAFVAHGAIGHSVGFASLPDKDRIAITGEGPWRSVRVYLPRGHFVVDCNIPGHAVAGMQLRVIVG